MDRERSRLFAGRGIRARSIPGGILLVALAFGVGIGAGWLTSLVPDFYNALTAPEPSVTPSPSASPLPSPTAAIPTPEPIVRELDDDDLLAGLLDLDVPFRGEGTFSVIPGETEPTEGAGTVRWVRIEFEDGLSVNQTALADFVLDTLNDNRGWGSEGRMQFVETEGVPDVRILFASPYTSEVLCTDPHLSAATGPVAEESEAADAPEATSPDASPTAEAQPETCASQGVIVISQYDWAAGLPTYGEERRQDSRRYLLGHFVGHMLGNDDQACRGGAAPLMVDQEGALGDCSPNPWAYPSAEPGSVVDLTDDAAATAEPS